MNIPHIKILADRWGEALDGISPTDHRAVKSMNEWISTWDRNACTHSAELFFIARHADGRLGYLYEAELDDGFVPTTEQIERARSCAAGAGEFTYVPPNSGVDVFNERAAYWVFFPGRFADPTSINETAKLMERALWGVEA